MYLLYESTADEHPIKKTLHLEGLKLIEFPQKKLKEVMGDIAVIQAMWNEYAQKIVQDALFVSEGIELA